MAARPLAPGTLAVHGGERLDPATGSVVTPIHQTSTFAYPKRPTGDGRWVDAEWIYTRYANPTISAAEAKVAALERAPRSLAFSSGMAAIAAAVLARVTPGDRVAALEGIYGGTQGLLATQAPQFGVHVDTTPEVDAGALADLATDATRVLLAEVPTNPFNRVLDVGDLAARVRRRWGRGGPSVVVDATFATPLNLRPVEAGATVSVHSATKYLNGHSDIIGGVLSGAAADLEPLEAWRRAVGASMDPHQAFLLARGAKTLEVRMRRAEANAGVIAKVLAASRKVADVWHLSLPDHPDYKMARRTLDGPGAIVAFRLRTDTVAAARRFYRALDLFMPAPSLGGVESLVSLPVETSHAGLTPRRRRAQGITPGTVRLAVGIETPDDLETDVRRALRAV